MGKGLGVRVETVEAGGNDVKNPLTEKKSRYVL